MRRGLQAFIILNVLAGAAFPQVILEDFSSRRTNFDSPPDTLFQLYLGEDANQVDHGLSNGVWHITGASAAGNTNGCYTGCGTYWQMFTYPYVYPGGFMQTYVKSGTFTAGINRLNFKFYCTANMARDTAGGDSLQIGTYIKPHGDTTPANQGQHYYHEFDFNVYSGHWILAEMNMQPQHVVGGPTTDPPYDPEFTSPTQGSPVHYFDGMTRWYFDSQGPSWASADCYFKDIEMRQVNNEPDTLVSSTTGQWTGSRFEVSWATQANSTQSYNIYYSRNSMHTNGLTSGTASGSVTATGDAYKGVYWASPNLPLSTGLYVAIQPQGNSQFTEVFIPPMDAGGTGQFSPCDLNQDGMVNDADVTLARNAALSGTACNNLDQSGGPCNVIDVQRIINASQPGGTCLVGP